MQPLYIVHSLQQAFLSGLLWSQKPHWETHHQSCQHKLCCWTSSSPLCLPQATLLPTFKSMCRTGVVVTTRHTSHEILCRDCFWLHSAVLNCYSITRCCQKMQFLVRTSLLHHTSMQDLPTPCMKGVTITQTYRRPKITRRPFTRNILRYTISG